MRSLLPLIASLLLSAPLAAQAPTPNTLQAGTQLVLIDVVIEDKHGNPIHGLTRDDFRLTEDNHPQTLRNFDEHTASTPPPNPPAFHLPPGTFTDYTPIPPTPALNILLLDALNTPTKDQAFVRLQLQQFVQHAPPGARIAILGLANRLTLLQGFTSDPEILKDAVDHKLSPNASTLLPDAQGYGAVDSQTAADIIGDAGGPTQVLASIAQFETQAANAKTQSRIQSTLDAFNILAHYLAAFPGRKNLIWFSGSFPINILPDPTLQDPFANAQFNEDEFRETTSLLSRAEVAVYPVDARGLLDPPVYSAANPAHNYAGNPSRLSKERFSFYQSQADENRTMDQLATATGGRAFYDTDNLAAAVSKAIQSGANFYTLAYIPTSSQPDGKYHTIHVDLTPEAAARLAPGHPSLQLSYRRGYFADRPPKSSPSQLPTPQSASPSAALAAATAYVRAAMDRGAPAPQDVVFKVRVLPASTATETTLAPGNALNPASPLKGPYQRLNLDFATLPQSITLTPSPDSIRSGKLQFLALLYDTNGALLNAVAQTLYLHVQPSDFDRFLQTPVKFHLEISSPPQRETFLRLGILDTPSNRIGVLELPTSTILHLPPAPTPH